MFHSFRMNSNEHKKIQKSDILFCSHMCLSNQNQGDRRIHCNFFGLPEKLRTACQAGWLQLGFFFFPSSSPSFPLPCPFHLKRKNSDQLQCLPWDQKYHPQGRVRLAHIICPPLTHIAVSLSVLFCSLSSLFCSIFTSILLNPCLLD